MSAQRLEPMTGCGILGALKCVAGMPGVLPMIHGPLSCSSGHRLALLYAGVEPLLPTTNVTDPDIVLGTLDRLERALEEAWARYHPPLLALILTCATSMAGEDFSRLLLAYERRTGGRAILVDGSALAGDELTAPYEVYRLLCEAWALTQGPGPDIVLEGLARTDYGSAWEYPALSALVERATGRTVLPGLFSGMDAADPRQRERYNRARKYQMGLLWKNSTQAIPAPYGIEGTRSFLESLCGPSGLTAEGVREHLDQAAAMEPLAARLKALAIPVAVESAGWQGYGLARFLSRELGCRVLLSVDQEIPDIPWEDVCEEFYEDVGRFELVELMEAFGTRLAFGSSNIQADGRWEYIPLFQPVWRTVEAEGVLMGYEGAQRVAQALLALAEGKT